MSEGDKSGPHQAKLLAAYIASKYGSEQLGLIKLLAAHSEFQTAASEGKQLEFAGLTSMLSFEKVLKETHGICYKRIQDASGELRFQLSDGSGTRSYRDDAFGTVSRHLVAELAALHPVEATFKRGPVVQLGFGVDVSAVLGDLDPERLAEYFRSLGPEHSAASKTYDDHTESVVKEEPCAEYRMFEFLSAFFTNLRSKEIPSTMPGDIAEFADPGESFLVVTGELVRSLRLTSEPKPTMKKMLHEAHPGGTWDGFNFLVRAPFDPFRLIGSSRSAIEPVSVVAPVPGKPFCVLPPPNVGGAALVEITDTASAVQHVLAGVQMDINASGVNKTRLLYGCDDGEEVWNSISQIKRGLMLKSLPSSALTPSEWIETLADRLARFSVKFGHDRVKMLALAAGRTVAVKGQIEFSHDHWIKK